LLPKVVYLLCTLYNLCVVLWYYPLIVAICEVCLLKLTCISGFILKIGCYRIAGHLEVPEGRRYDGIGSKVLELVGRGWRSVALENLDSFFAGTATGGDCAGRSRRAWNHTDWQADEPKNVAWIIVHALLKCRMNNCPRFTLFSCRRWVWICRCTI
jgi:hypothetical protein